MRVIKNGVEYKAIRSFDMSEIRIYNELDTCIAKYGSIRVMEKAGYSLKPNLTLDDLETGDTVSSGSSSYIILEVMSTGKIRIVRFVQESKVRQSDESRRTNGVSVRDDFPYDSSNHCTLDFMKANAYKLSSWTDKSADMTIITMKIQQGIKITQDEKDYLSELNKKAKVEKPVKTVEAEGTKKVVA